MDNIIEFLHVPINKGFIAADSENISSVFETGYGGGLDPTSHQYQYPNKNGSGAGRGKGSAYGTGYGLSTLYAINPNTDAI